MRSFIRWGLKNNFRGFGFLVKSFYKNRNIILKTKFNSSFYIDPYEKIDSAIARFGYFDEDVYLALKEILTPNDIFWDIGANIGIHCITLKVQFPMLKCIAFEPNPPAIVKFIDNCKLNSVNIPIYAIALGDSNIFTELLTNQNNLGATGFVYTGSINERKTGVNVFISTVDELIQYYKIQMPTVMKIDTEGYELQILNGSKYLLESKICKYIVFEANSNIDEIIDFLQYHSYSIRKLSDAPNYIATLV